MEDEIIEEFLVEAGEGIARIEQDLVALEAEPGQRELVDRIFRDVHTIKGVCGFIGLTRLERVTHAGESLLSQIRAGRRAVDAGVISALLATVDAIRVMVGYVRETGSDGEEDYDALIRRLDQVEQSDPLDSVPPLGEILESRGVPRASIQDALAAQEAGDPRRLGEILVRRGTIRPADLDEALRIQAEAKQAVTSASEGTIRVSVDLLDKLMNLVGELVLVRNQIRERSGDSDDSIASANAQRLDLVTAELQEGVMKTRMQPIGTAWGKLPRIVRDVSTACGKRLRLELEGKETELDRTIIEAIRDPLTHLVRNACDHGVEEPHTREAAGKCSEGTLAISARHEGGQVVIEVTDDGRGIDPRKLAAKAVEKGLITAAQAERLGEREALHLIFLPGFSTAGQITNVSGRGVGMDVVKTNIEGIGGTIDVSSVVGRGTTIRIKIPLTLAIIPALVVACAGDSYAIPQVSLVELVMLERDSVERVHGTPVYRLRDELLPLVFLSDQLALGPVAERDEPYVVVVVEVDGRRLGLVVDEVRDTEEIVVKPLAGEIGEIGVYAGATIMGDGSVALILDVPGLAAKAGFTRDAERGPRNGEEERTDRALERSEALLVFESAGDARVAIPLARIDRLEEIPPERVERVSGRDVVQYRGSIMPLCHLAHTLHGVPLEKARSRADGERWQVVVVPAGGDVIGLVVDRLFDIVEATVDLRGVGRRHGVLGTSVVAGRVVEILDLDAVVAGTLPRGASEPRREA